LSDLIEGKIAKIFTDIEIAINRGSEHGVTEGMKFHITTPYLEVVDPDTGESIGGTYYTKGHVSIISVYKKFSIARSDRTIAPADFGILALKTKPLKVRDYELTRDDEINIGDRVIEDRPTE